MKSRKIFLNFFLFLYWIKVYLIAGSALWDIYRISKGHIKLFKKPSKRGRNQRKRLSHEKRYGRIVINKIERHNLAVPLYHHNQHAGNSHKLQELRTRIFLMALNIVFSWKFLNFLKALKIIFRHYPSSTLKKSLYKNGARACC